MCHSIQRGDAEKMVKENAFEISLYHLHPLALCSAEVIHFQSNLTPNFRKIPRASKKTLSQSVLNLDLYRSVSLKVCFCKKKEELQVRINNLEK